MGYHSRINNAFEGALRLPLNMQSRYVIFSDCHRGIGKANDNFTKNEFIYIAALNYYFHRDFTYIELGDGDELWENRNMNAIKDMHQHSFDVLAKFFKQNKFYSVYGNHDIVKKYSRYADLNFCSYYCDNNMCTKELFPNITFYSGIILESKTQNNIYLTHGHQADFLNSTLWHLSRFLVRYIWKPLESLGIPDPTSAAKNNKRKNSTEKKLTNWAKQNQHILITGHTHHPMMGTGNSPYYNTGSCVSPYGITCIEIYDGCIHLIKWALDSTDEQIVYVSRSELDKRNCMVL
ncbi:MAG: serine/threonine protein phosphatase [Eubacterium sp.]|jgi:UDP-2,3-diacylglucosamine pyrophosphatase LpxH|nr:serine/threonine protein phosphatase [Eubacterium sp.]